MVGNRVERTVGWREEEDLREQEGVAKWTEVNKYGGGDAVEGGGLAVVWAAQVLNQLELIEWGRPKRVKVGAKGEDMLGGGLKNTGHDW